jgi:hypothetical protein
LVGFWWSWSADCDRDKFTSPTFCCSHWQCPGLYASVTDQ